MKNLLTTLSFAVMMLVVACTQNAITGRSQLSLVGEGQLQEMAQTEYRTFLSQNKVVSASQSKDAEMVKRVGSRVAAAVTNYYKGKGMGSEFQNYQDSKARVLPTANCNFNFPEFFSVML